MANAKLTPEVENVLRRSKIEGNVLNLPEQLERPMYEAVMKVIANCGGKWKRGKGHVFESDPRIKLGIALDTGMAVDEKKKFQAFFTPLDLVRRMVLEASVEDCSVLEPSAGDGRIADACVLAGADPVHCIEINPEYEELLGSICDYVQIADFLKIPHDNPLIQKCNFDRVIMNPPFTNKQDLKHVGHAIKFLRKGGRLVAIMQGNRTTEEILKFMPMDEGFTINRQKLDPGEFKESGTNIATQIVVIDK